MSKYYENVKIIKAVINDDISSKCISKMEKQDQSAPGPTPSSMVPVVRLVHLDPPWSAISGVWLHEVDQAGSRWTRSGPGARAEP